MANVWTPAVSDVWEEKGSPQEVFSAESGLQVSVTLRCAWDDRFAVLDDILQNQYTYPRCPGSQCNARTGSSRPYEGKMDSTGTGDSLATYDQALITINYTQDLTREDNGSGGFNIFSESLEPSAEFLTLSPAKFRWTNSSGPKLRPEEAPGKLIVGYDYVQTRYQMASIPVEVINPGPGVVNNAAITAQLLGLTFPIETVLYQNSQPQRTISTSGVTRWTIPSRFSIRPNGWNKFWRPSTGWDEIYDEDAAAIYKNYPLADLSNLLV